jgi:carbamoyltransferase
MTAILGLNAYHPDAVACLLVDGRVVAAVAEERLGRRIKHYAAFPSCAIRSVLEMAGLRLKDVDYVALGHDNNANLSASFPLSPGTRSDRRARSCRTFPGAGR